MGLFGRINMGDPFVLTWNVSAIVTILLPLLAFTTARLTNQEDWYNYQQNQNQNGEENGQNNNYNDPYANPENYDEYGNYVGPTHWWQFWKKNNRNNNNEGGGEQREYDRTPWWFVWGDRREGQPEEEEGSTAVLLIYVWTLVAMAVMIYLANRTGMQIHKLEGLRWALLGFANYCFVTMVLLIGLEGIETEGRALEEDGFYGQTAVLLFLTCFFGLVQAIVFVSWTTKRLAAAQLENSNKSEGFVNVDYARSPSSGYMGTEPEKSPSSGWFGP